MAEVLTHNQAYSTPQDALAHYGVKGMKWGVRKDQPKGAVEPRAINEERAAKYQKNADFFQAEIDAIKAKPAPRLKMTQRSRDNQIATLATYRDQQQKAADDIRSGRKLTDEQRKLLVGAAVAGSLLAAYGAYSYVDSGKFNAHVNRAPWNKNDALRHAKTEDDIFSSVVTPINRGYGDYGTKMNCRRCTFAYEMRRRGYDVKATKSNAGTGQTLAGMMNATTPGAKNATGKWGVMLQAMREGRKEGGILDTLEKQGPWGENKIAFTSTSADQRSRSIFAALSKEPNGSRGEVGVGWTMGGGHSMAYEIVQGRPVIFDAQSGTKYNSPDAFEKFARVVTEAGFTRLDNKTLNDEFLRRWLQNAD